MNRRNFILGMTAVAFVATTNEAQARAWGANGYMTRRMKVVKASAVVAFNEGKLISDNPYHIDTMEFEVWAVEYNRAAYFGNTSPEEYQAYLQSEIDAENAEIDRRRDEAKEMQDNMARVGLGIAGLLSITVFLGAIFSTKEERDELDASRPWEK